MTQSEMSHTSKGRGAESPVSPLTLEIFPSHGQSDYVNTQDRLVGASVGQPDSLPGWSPLRLPGRDIQHSVDPCSRTTQDSPLANAIADSWAAMRLSEPWAACW
jgi:hypothetical protein